MKTTLTVIIFSLTFLLGQTACSQNEVRTDSATNIQKESVNQKKDSSKTVLVLPAPDTLSIIGVGDMMLGTNYPESSFLPPNDGKGLFAEVNHILSAADLTFGNLEGVVLDQGGQLKNCNNPKLCYAFRMPEKLVDNLSTAGFDVLSIANNHMGDFGQSGRENTMKVLKDKGFEFAGLLSCPSTSFEKEGVKYGFAAFAPNSGTVDIRRLEEAEAIVKKLAEENDVVIVSFHGGAEGPQHRNVSRKTEIFYGENRGNVYEFAHRMIDAGADVIFGHGPHVTRAVEVYKERFIAYSMGNFCTYRRFNLVGPNGIAPIIKLFTDKTGKFLKGEITPIIQIPPGGVKIDPNKKVIAEIRRLCASDFPESPVSVETNGEIVYKK